MKKFLFLLLICFLLSGCSSKGTIETILDQDLPGCKMIQEIDNHGGFLGDGILFSKLDCSKANIDFSNWKEFPLSDNIKEVYDMDVCDTSGCGVASLRYGIPDIEEGYYYFYDRHYESKDRFDDIDLNTRASYNFSLIMFDKKNNMMYYYELDT